MLEVLAQNPDVLIDIRDDKNAATFLLELGMIGKFSKNPSLSQPWFSMIFTKYGTHFIVGVSFSGFADEKENGYAAHCFPYKHFSSKRVCDWIDSMYEGHYDPDTLMETFLDNENESIN